MEHSSQDNSPEVPEYHFSKNQLNLFPLDPWGAEHIFEVFDRPVAGIARAMIGPIPLASEAKGHAIDIRCLAVTEDQEFVALLEVPSIKLDTPDLLWATVLHKLEIAKRQPIETNSAGPLTPPDCVKTWLEIETWSRNSCKNNTLDRCSHALAKLFESQLTGSEFTACDERSAIFEMRANTAIAHQISIGVDLVLSALQSELLGIITHRNRLSVSMACKLLALARSHNVVVVKYAHQALRTESFGVIALITSGQPPNESLLVRDAIFTGKSLPEAFENVGVPKASHRRAICKTSAQNVRQSQDNFALSDLAMSGQQWLVAMRLSALHPPQTTTQWQDFAKFVQCLCTLNLQDSRMVPSIVQWCAKSKYKSSSEKLNFLFHYAKSLQVTAAWLDSLDISFEDALVHSLGLLHDSNDWRPLSYSSEFKLDLKDVSALVKVLAKATGKSLDDLMRRILDLHPGVPDTFNQEHPGVASPLHTFDLALSHGRIAGNCLSSVSIVMDYISSGTALYAVRTANGVLGTVALLLDSSDDQPRVYVSEIQECDAEPTKFEISHIAKLLADACSTNTEIPKWTAYASLCASWRQCL